METNEKQPVDLPENAFRELKPGEEYKPILSPEKVYPEVNAWSVSWGIVMAVIFSAAAAFLGLKVGQVFEAAIPIAIIAVGLSGAAKRKNALGENVIIQSIGACSSDCRRCYLHFAGFTHFTSQIPRTDRELYGSIHEFAARRYIGYLVSPFRSVNISFRICTEIPLPRSYGYDSGTCFGRKSR